MVTTISKIYFYDTNAVLDLQDRIFDTKFYLSSVTLEELEKIKTSSRHDEAVKYKARKILHLLDEKSDEYKVVIYTTAMENIINEKNIEVSPDTKIISCCVFSKGLLPKGEEFVFVTNDIACKMIASKIFGLEVESVGEKENIYKGYRVIKGSSEQINAIMENMDLSDWNINEYLIIKNTDDDSEKEMRFDGENFVSLKLPSSRYIKAKNSLQRCALDILNNPDITIAAILGGYGSGKTFISLQMALYNVNEKGYQLCEDSLKNCKKITLKTIVTILCLKHNINFQTSVMSLDNNDSCNCPQCLHEKLVSVKSKSSIEEVKKICKEKDYELLTTSIENCDSRVKYICNKHRDYGIQSTSLYGLKHNKTNCRMCRMPKNENHWNWAGGITSERDKIKNTSQYKQWVQDVFERDNYTCQCCGNSGVYLEAHHLYNFSEYPDLRMDINNGVTLCHNCHSITVPGSFHSVYTQFHNTPEQLDEYINNYKNNHSREPKSRLSFIMLK